MNRPVRLEYARRTTITIESDTRKLPANVTIRNDKKTGAWLADDAEPDWVPPSARTADPPRSYFQGESRTDLERKMTYAGYKAVTRNRWKRTADDKGHPKK